MDRLSENFEKKETIKDLLFDIEKNNCDADKNIKKNTVGLGKVQYRKMDAFEMMKVSEALEFIDLKVDLDLQRIKRIESMLERISLIKKENDKLVGKLKM